MGLWRECTKCEVAGEGLAAPKGDIFFVPQMTKYSQNQILTKFSITVHTLFSPSERRNKIHGTEVSHVSEGATERRLLARWNKNIKKSDAKPPSSFMPNFLSCCRWEAQGKQKDVKTWSIIFWSSLFSLFSTWNFDVRRQTWCTLVFG